MRPRYLPALLALTLSCLVSAALAQVRKDAATGDEKGSTLELRIVANSSGCSRQPVIEHPAKWQEDLAKNGPLAGRQRDAEFQWFELDSDLRGDLQKGTYQGCTYVLLCGKSPYVMTSGWGLEDVRMVADNNGRPSLSLTFDEAGSQALARITKANLGNRMAVLVDGKVLSAPTIRAQIARRALIAGNFTAEEARGLAAALRIGMVPKPGSDK